MKIGRDPWSADETWRAVELYSVERLGAGAIARILDRTEASVRNKLTHLRKLGQLGPRRGPAGRPRLNLPGRRCPHCDGTGSVHDFTLVDACSKCDGTGRLGA